jgi:hypothetical protein
MKHSPSHSCSCCACACQRLNRANLFNLNRRDFVTSLGAFTIGGLALSSLDLSAVQPEPAPARPARWRQPLKVQPVLTYDVPKRREGTSWRNWGGIQTEADAQKEQARIGQELGKMAAESGCQIEILPVLMTRSDQEGANIAKGAHDVMLIFAAGGSLKLLESLTLPDKWNLMFLRHLPGPAYLWYEIVSPRFLRKTVDEYGQPGFSPEDVVVDSYAELAAKLRGLHGLKNTWNKKVVCIGGAAGWGAGGQKAPDISRKLWKLDLVDYPYKDLAPRMQQAYDNAGLVKRCQNDAAKYLKQSGITLQTKREFVERGFVLREVMADLMDEARTDAITINACMGTIMGISKTTACLPLSLLNDEGYLAFCESDFVVIPSGILLHYIANKPVFLNDPTYPHDNIVTLAHCTAPRKMDGRKYEKTKILTHFESDYGAAPKVEMRLGQVTTNLVPDFNCKKWIGFSAVIVGNPFLDICRSQIDVRVSGDAVALMKEMKGFHWMLSYGNYLRECGYALNKLGVEFLDVSAPKT